LAVNSALKPFFPAGFYYKTFMWPKSFWEKIYEPIIRHSAGLGRISFEADPDTKAIAIYSEPGGRMEAELAEWVKENKSRLPIVAFMAGRFMDEMPGMRFGHAGTIVEGKADTTADKIERMRAAGISVAERIEEIPALISERLAEAS